VLGRRERRTKLARWSEFGSPARGRSVPLRDADDAATQILPSSSPQERPFPAAALLIRPVAFASVPGEICKDVPCSSRGRASSPAGGDPRGGYRPASVPPASGPSLPQRRTQWATTEGQTAGPGLASFCSPPPGKDWARPGYLPEPNGSPARARFAVISAKCCRRGDPFGEVPLEPPHRRLLSCGAPAHWRGSSG
jgi:hypothetical protein